MSDSVPLLPQHARLVDASAISTGVAEARGYFSASKRSELRDLGFDSYQQIVPALVVPSWGVDGRIVNYQSRPDRPRVDRDDGREVKYETVAGSTVRLDVPPSCRDRIGRPLTPLWITEGVRKGDALASAGLCAVALLGVWCFDTDDWGRVALDGRDVRVVYDSDVMRNPAVNGALQRLGAFLTAKGAAVQYVYLPEDDGKIGVDDYLAAGHTVEELCRLAQDELRPLPPPPAPERKRAWPTGVLLFYIERTLGRFVRFPSEHELAALALYVLHTWALDAAVATPYMLIVSPEKRAGKTRALETAELLVREPLRAANITAAGVFQAIEEWRPTLILDELDATFTAKSEQAETLRGVLNAGNRRGSYVVRGSQDGKPQKFSTFCPKLLAGINNGRLPDTIRDRAIVLAIERQQPDEPVEDLFPDELEAELVELRSRIGDWAAEHVGELTGWRRRERIRALDARLQEAWDPLLAIAELAGDDWPERAREAAKALAKGAADVGEEAHGHMLLAATRAIFAAEGSPLASQTVCEQLNADEELPFSGYGNGTGIKPRTLAKLLKPYAIKPLQVHVGDKQVRGYERAQFEGAWKRYAPEKHDARETPLRRSVTSVKSVKSQAQSQIYPSHDPSSIRHNGARVTDRGAAVTDVVTDKNPPGAGVVTDMTDLTDTRSPSHTRASSNGHHANGAVAAAYAAGALAPCANEAHRGHEWVAAEGRLECGICHPPVNLAVVR